MTTKQIMTAAAMNKTALAAADEETKNKALLYMADSLNAYTEEILNANKNDIEEYKSSVNGVMIDRLTLTGERIKAMADGIREVAALPDPVGRVLESKTRPNGLEIEKISVPIGVIAIIYESRPNVTSDAAALTLKSGNMCVLKCGKEAYRSCRAIVDALREGIIKAGLPENTVSLIEDNSRQGALELMQGVGYIDLLIPRGGAGLIKACVENAKVPCIQTGTGICHIYVDRDADIEKALDIIENAKTSRPSVCNAAEVCLVDRTIAGEFLPKLKDRLVDKRVEEGKTPVELRCDPEALGIINGVPANENDFDTEFLNYIMAIRIVGGVKEATEHIAKHSTGHSEAIITENKQNADRFLHTVDSAAVYHNASTRFTDGGEFGLGCEIGISTQKIHARGPMGLCEMTSYKYLIRGNGQIR